MAKPAPVDAGFGAHFRQGPGKRPAYQPFASNFTVSLNSRHSTAFSSSTP